MENKIMKHIIYFTAEWCNPCARTRPFAEELVHDGYNIKFVDADTETQLVKDLEVRSIPTFILFEDGKEIARMNGAKTKQQLLDFWG
jgi:thioredoxin-like negative regulator of GroEL